MLPLALVALLPSCRQYGRLLLWLCAALALVLTLQQERFGNSLAVPMAAAIALALHPLLARRPRLGAVAAALVLALAVPATASVLRVPEAEREAVRAWRAELVDVRAAHAPRQVDSYST